MSTALQRKLGFTMIYVTHDQTEAMSMADQVILMRKGRIEQDAPPEALYARPATAFAARFIGTPPMNVLRLVAGPDGAVVDARVDGAAAADPPVHANAVVCQADPARVELGIRSEHIRLAGVAQARAPVELSFYYPVAVGGSVTRTIDQLAADFSKENPDI